MNFSEIRKESVLVGSALIFTIGLVASAGIISSTDFYIRSLGGTDLTSGKVLNTIAVNGDGKIYAQPDMVQFDITVSELANTSEEALNKANDKISKIREELKDNDIDDKDIQTTNLSIYPEYDYNLNETRLKGQRATQTLNIKVRNIDAKAEKAAKVIDAVTEIENIQLGAITFDIEDKTELFSKAREQAYGKAEQKAKELADLSDVELLKPVSISDSNVEYNSPIFYNTAELSKAADSSAGSTSIAAGQLEIQVRVDVIFGIE